MLRLEWFEWTDDGYPTEGSLGRLERELKEADIFRAMELFYAALRENYYSDAVGETEVEVRGEPTRVWGYHTMGWIGNENIISVLRTSWLWPMLLERHDAGGTIILRIQTIYKIWWIA